MEFFGHAESWVLVSFILFLGLLVYLKVPAMVAKMLDDRAAGIARDLNEAKKLREEAASVLASYKAKLADAEKQAVSIIEGAKSDAAAYAEESKKKLSDLIDRRSRQAEFKIAQAEATAQKDVRAAAADLAIALAAQALGAQSKGKGGESLVADSISAVKTRLN
jgi:F-type H+-transporting ATPase subunit b